LFFSPQWHTTSNAKGEKEKERRSLLTPVVLLTGWNHDSFWGQGEKPLKEEARWFKFAYFLFLEKSRRI